MDKKLSLELEQPKFDRNRLRVYYGNIGEIIAQQVLKKQGFEVLLTRPVGYGRDFLSIFRLPKMDEEVKELRKYYDSLPSFRKKKETWNEFLKGKENWIKETIETVKASRAFFGGQLNAFKQYLKELKFDVASKRKYTPDLIAKKGEKIYVIEVKSTRGALKFLRGKKLRGLLLARKYGLIPSIVSFNLRIEAKDFKMEELVGDDNDD